MTLHEGGNPLEWYFGGSFTSIGGVPAARIVRATPTKGGGLGNAECH